MMIPSTVRIMNKHAKTMLCSLLAAFLCSPAPVAHATINGMNAAKAAPTSINWMTNTDTTSEPRQQLNECAWHLWSFSNQYGADSREQSAMQDVQRYLEAEIVRDKLTAEREKQLLTTCTHLQGYWLQVRNWYLNRKAWESFLRLNKLDAATAHDAQVTTQEQRLHKTLQNPPDATWSEQMTALVEAYNTERINLSKAVARHTPEESVERTSSCPAPLEAQGDNDKPRIARQSAAPDAYFPAVAARHSLQGSVVVELFVNEQGCVTRAGVAVSSGVPMLDEAAIRYAFEGVRYLPATKDGRAFATPHALRVTFKQGGQ